MTMKMLSSIAERAKQGLGRAIRRFGADTSGTLLAESMFIVPVMAPHFRPARTRGPPRRTTRGLCRRRGPTST